MVAWLWSPVIFNPNGVEWLDVIKDFDGWLSWMMAGDDDPDKSWHAWWIQQNAVRTIPNRFFFYCWVLLNGKGTGKSFRFLYGVCCGRNK